MAINNAKAREIELLEPSIPLGSAIIILSAAGGGTIGTMMVLRYLLPGLGASFIGAQPKAYWDLARSSGIVAYLLMWLSVSLGLIITNRLARVWPGGPTAFDLHQFASLLGLAFAIFHGLVLLGDQYIKYSPLQILVPFASVNFQPVWVGLGQVAFYLLIPITFSFYVRRQISSHWWRAIHYGTFITFSLITIHALLSGSDSKNWMILAMYALTGASVIYFTLHRIFSLVLSEA